jgi:myo-inositol-1(or 4)-monophosphatase
MHPLLNIAITAARKAGKVITRYIDERDTLKIHEKGVNDLVTMVDQNAEHEIIHIIQKAYPEHSILGEETGFHEGDDTVWVIDPLDGTMNYIHGFPHFAVSIAVKYKDTIEHAVIYDPISQDLYTASKGSGAQLNGKRIRASKRVSLEGALVGSSFPYNEREKHFDEQFDKQFKVFKEVYTVCADVRRTGSAALNLAYVAAGYLDGFWETGLKEWDMAAGVLLVKEAGGYVSDFQGENHFLSNGNIIAGTRKVHAELFNLLY